MGICIYYQGQLRDPAQLSQLVIELRKVCASLQWPCHEVDERILGVGERLKLVPLETDDGIPTDTAEVVEEPVDDHWRGLVIHPPGCELLYLTFNRQGRLVVYRNAWSDRLAVGRYGIWEHLSIKTQFSSPETHIRVCELLRLVERYASEWEVFDDGGYWETGDYEALRAQWARYQAIFDALSDPQVIQAMLKKAGLDVEVSEPPEVGKVIQDPLPFWREEWGVSAGEN